MASQFAVPTQGLRPEIQRQLDQAVEELKGRPEYLSEALPEVLYVVDDSDAYDLETDEGNVFTASLRQEDLLGVNSRKPVGVYVLIAVQDVEKVTTLKIHATDLASPERPVVDFYLGDGGLTVAGEEVIDD